MMSALMISQHQEPEGTEKLKQKGKKGILSSNVYKPHDKSSGPDWFFKPRERLLMRENIDYAAPHDEHVRHVRFAQSIPLLYLPQKI